MRTTTTTRSKLMLLFMAFALVLALPATAFADEVRNDVVVGGNDTITAGGSTTIKYKINPGSSADTQSGCNVSDGTPGTVHLNVPANVTASETSLTFSKCNDEKAVTFSSNVAGQHAIGVSKVVDTGGGTYYFNDASFTLKVNAAAPSDTTAPVITPSVQGTLGDNGWYTSNATVSWSVTDPDSTVTSPECGSTTISSDTAGQTVTCSATSAGGTNSQSVTIKRDATAPVISGADVNDTTWRNSNLSQGFTASDATSGLSNGADASFSLTASLESANANAPTTDSKTVTDAAGNSATRSLSALIDKTAPVITNNGPTTGANNNGWYNSNVTNTFSASDALSGLANAADASISKDTQGEGRALKVASGDVADLAGNVAPSVDSRGFDVDKTAPTNVAGTPDRAANTNGWYNSAVTVSFAGDDALSGIANCSSGTYNGPDDGAASVGGSCRDLAGNSANGSFGLKYDATAPTLNPSVSPNPVLLNGSATATSGARDNLSGLASQGCDQVNTGSVGTKSVSCSATDQAGNQSSASAPYNVNYDFKGFFRPVDNGGVYNVAKAGSSIPVKFSLTGNQGFGIIETGFPKATAVSCSANATTDALEETTTSNSGLTYDASIDQYNYVWKTQSTYAGKCFRFDMKLIDGTTQSALFKFTK